jgi:hypothetical protein
MMQARFSTAVLALVSLLVFGAIGFRLLGMGSGDADSAWDGLIREIPDKITVYPLEGRMVLTTKKVDPVPSTLANEILPRWVEVFTKFPDGTEKPGVYFANLTDHPTYSLSGPTRGPRHVGITAEGNFKITEGAWKHMVKYVKKADAPNYNPGHIEAIDDTEFVRINYNPLDIPDLRGIKQFERSGKHGSNGHRADFGYYIDSGIPSDIASKMGPSVQRSQNLINAMLSPSSGSILIEVRFEDFGPRSEGSIAKTNPVLVLPSYSTVRVAMINYETQLSGIEAALLDALPSGNSIKCTLQGGTSFLSTVLLSGYIWNQWYFINPGSSTITFNSRLKFDFDPTNGIDADAFDFEGSLVHESLHAIGFVSEGDSALSPYLSSLDFFRLSGTLSRSVTYSTMQSQPRYVRPGDAFTVCALNSPQRSYDMSRGRDVTALGDGNETSHWRDDTNSSVWIGIMDPTTDEGVLDPTYLTSADIYAMDIAGWDIDPNDVPAPPNMPGLIEPADGLPDVPRIITLSFGPTTSSTSVFVFRQSPWPSEADMVFAAREISGGEVTVPYGVLRGSTTYTWFATAIAPHGFAISEPRAFTTGCAADFDLTGFVDTDDVDAFVQAYELGDISADVDATGFVDTDDLDFFMQAYANGC